MTRRACATPCCARSNSGSAEPLRDLPASFDPDVVHAIGARLAAVADEHAQAVTRELGSGVLSVAVRTWVHDQFRSAEVFDVADDLADDRAEDRERAAEGSRRMLRRWAPGAGLTEEGTR